SHFIDSATLVGHAEDRHAGRGFLYLDRQGTAARHRVPGIDGEVHDDLLELPAVRLHHHRMVSQFRDELDVVTDQALQETTGARDDVVQIENLGVQDLAARE